MTMFKFKSSARSNVRKPFFQLGRTLTRLLLVAGLLLSTAVAVPTSTKAAGTVITVDTAADHADDGCVAAPGDCTLREAINLSNSTPDIDTIVFAIPGVGVHTIAPSSDLPPITQPSIIDATTQYGTASSQARQPLIALDGGGTRSIGFWILGGGTTVAGFTIA